MEIKIKITKELITNIITIIVTVALLTFVFFLVDRSLTVKYNPYEEHYSATYDEKKEIKKTSIKTVTHPEVERASLQVESFEFVDMELEIGDTTWTGVLSELEPDPQFGKTYEYQIFYENNDELTLKETIYLDGFSSGRWFKNEYDGITVENRRGGPEGYESINRIYDNNGEEVIVISYRRPYESNIDFTIGDQTFSISPLTGLLCENSSTYSAPINWEDTKVHFIGLQINETTGLNHGAQFYASKDQVFKTKCDVYDNHLVPPKIILSDYNSEYILVGLPNGKYARLDFAPFDRKSDKMKINDLFTEVEFLK